MKLRPALLLVLWLCASASAQSQTPRIWTDDSGGFRVEATLVAFAGEQIKLRRADEQVIAAPIARLSEVDKAFLRRRALANQDAAASWPLLFTGPGEGLRGEYFRDMSLDEIGLERTDESIEFTLVQHRAPYEGGIPVREISNGWPQHFAVRWTGLLVPRHSERYTLSLEMDDGAALWLGDDLLIHQWQFKGNKEYTAEVELIAGKPYPLRILYYNSWFGGGIKFRWSSKSQRKQIVPRTALFLPSAPADTAPVGESVSLSERVSSKEIPLSAPIHCDPLLNKPTLLLCPLADGAFKLGWTDAKGDARVTSLSETFESRGKDLIIPKVNLRGLTVDREGRSTLLLADMPNRMWLMQLDTGGKLLWRNCLVGEKGREADQHFLDEHFSFTGRLATAEDQVAAHFAHSWNTGKNGVHQGGFFTLVGRDGKAVQEEKWTVSHSLDQRVLFHRGCWFTLSAGDCYPKGLHVQNRTLGFGRVFYPAVAEREAFGNCGGFVNARLGGLTPLGADLAVTFITKQDGAPRLYFTRLASDCTVVCQQKLADLPADATSAVVKSAPFRDLLVTAWSDGAKATNLQLVSRDGQPIGRPESVPYPLPAHDDLCVLPGGDVVWLTGQKGDASIRLARISAR